LLLSLCGLELLELVGCELLELELLLELEE
jgi:hypothetical protein